MTAPGNVSAEKLAVDYLTKVTTIALRYLPKGDRIKFVGHTRALIERRCGPLALADPDRVADVLAELGEPLDLVKRERARIDEVRARRRAAAQGGPVAPWVQRPVTSRLGPASDSRQRPRLTHRSSEGGPASPDKPKRRRWPGIIPGARQAPRRGTPSGQEAPTPDSTAPDSAAPDSTAPGSTTPDSAAPGPWALEAAPRNLQAVSPPAGEETAVRESGEAASPAGRQPGEPPAGAGAAGAALAGPDTAEGAPAGEGAAGEGRAGTAAAGHGPARQERPAAGSAGGAAGEAAAGAEAAEGETAEAGIGPAVAAEAGQGGSAEAADRGPAAARGSRQDQVPADHDGVTSTGREHAAGAEPGSPRPASPAAEGPGGPGRAGADQDAEPGSAPRPELPPASAGPMAAGPATIPGLPLLDPVSGAGSAPGGDGSPGGGGSPGQGRAAGPGRGPAARPVAVLTSPRATLPPLTWGSLVAMARAQRREAVAVILLGVGGVLFPLPFWLLGAAAAALSRYWEARYKWLALFGPLLVTLAGALPITALARGHSSAVAVYLHILRVDSKYLVRAGCLLTAAYLTWLVRRGPKVRVPPWRR